MIKKISANHATFKTVEFHRGFNVIWADRMDQSTKLDSRNGLGKSTLIEIIHFCLGSSVSKGKGLLVEALAGWEFTLHFEAGGQQIVVTRSTADPNFFLIGQESVNWPISPKLRGGQLGFGLKDWRAVLGTMLFGLPKETEDPYKPNFRSLISYFIRRGKDAFSTPFEYFRKQLEWDKQVSNAFLLGLSWEDASELQHLKDQKKGIQNLRQAAKSGIVKGYVGSLGELEARRVRLKRKADQETEDLSAFRVHPQYEEIRLNVNRYTEDIHAAANQNSVNQRMLALYEKSLAEEDAPHAESIERIYAEAGAALPGITLRRIEDVERFHSAIIKNRRSFLSAEVQRLRQEIQNQDSIIKEKSDLRSRDMKILQTHGALEEYTLLQTRHLDTVNVLNSITSTIENLKSCETGLSEIKIRHEVLRQKVRRDYEDRQHVWEKAIELFNTYTERLYSVPGRLVIDVGATGFKFDVEIERSGSTGISNMKVFCYDMTLASIWATKSISPRLLVHDSIIFDGVDERQMALALEMAAYESNSRGFQYICTLNSDDVPWQEFSKAFDLREYVRVSLTDQNLAGCLLGVRF